MKHFFSKIVKLFTTLPELLHFFEKVLSVLELEVGLGEVGVEDLLLRRHPLLGHVAFREKPLNNKSIDKDSPMLESKTSLLG